MARTPTTPPIAPAITPTASLGWGLPATKPLVAGNGDGVAAISHISVEEEFIQGFPESLQIDHFRNKSFLHNCIYPIAIWIVQEHMTM